MPHVCPSGQVLDTAPTQTRRGLAGAQRCTPVLTAQFGWQMGYRLAFICALSSSHLYKTHWILTG